jgi:hypothetical protein
MFGCVFFVLMLQNLFLMISNDGKTNALNEVREKEYERYKEIYALKKQVEVLEHKLSSKS